MRLSPEAGPHGAIPLLKQQADGRLKLPLTLRPAFRFPAKPLQDAHVGRGPQVVVAVADHGEHRVPREPILGPVYHHASGGREPGDAVGGAEPDVARAVLLERTDAVARKPFPHGAHGHAIFFEAVDAAAGGPQPQAAFVVFVQASNDLIGEPVAGLIGSELPLGKPAEAGAVRADPQPAAAIRKKPQDAGWRVPVAWAVGAEAPLAVLAQPAGMRADPQRAPGARRQSPDRVVGQAVLGGEYSFHAVFEPVQPVVGAHPDSPGGGLQQDVHGGFPATFKDGSGPAPIEPRQASVGTDPQHAPRIH